MNKQGGMVSYSLHSPQSNAVRGWPLSLGASGRIRFVTGSCPVMWVDTHGVLLNTSVTGQGCLHLGDGQPISKRRGRSRPAISLGRLWRDAAVQQCVCVCFYTTEFRGSSFCLNKPEGRNLRLHQ